MERPRAAFWELHRKLGESFDAEMTALREELTSLKRLQTSLSEEHVTPIDDSAIARQKSPVSGDSFRSRLSPHGPPPPEEEIQFLESLGDVSPDTSNRWSSTSFADDLRVALGSRADVRRIVQQQTQGTFGRIDEDSIGGRISGTGGDENHFEFKLREFWHRAVDEEPLAEGPSGPSGGRKHSSSAQMVFPDSSKAIIGGSARESVLPFIQHPGSPLRAWWDVLGMTLLTFDIVVIPLRFFDPPETLVLVIMSWVTQLFWNLDILVSFITGYYHKGILVLDLRRIVKHYATTWFPFDATVVGIDWLLYGLEGRNQTAGVARLSKTVRILRFLRLVRLARLAKVSTMVEALQEQINSQVATIHYSIFKIIGRMMLLNHVIACSWWGIAQLDEGQPNWISENQLEGRSIEYQYSTALHWSLTQLGVGQTNIEAVNFAERLFSIFITFCALITFSTLVSSVTSLMASLQRLKTEEIEQFRSLRRFLVQNEIPADLGHRVTRFLQYTYALRHEALSLDVHLPILNLLSKPLQAELQLARYRECLRECAFFDRLLQHDSFHVVRVLREVATGALLRDLRHSETEGLRCERSSARLMETQKDFGGPGSQFKGRFCVSEFVFQFQGVNVPVFRRPRAVGILRFPGWFLQCLDPRLGILLLLFLGRFRIHVVDMPNLPRRSAGFLRERLDHAGQIWSSWARSPVVRSLTTTTTTPAATIFVGRRKTEVFSNRTGHAVLHCSGGG
ncbi:HCN1 [Symbiodinium sp. CCMP2456]|nr:HCN1 [Symbiodinium sp. CCMP2456]